jgi:hypothetical protein
MGSILKDFEVEKPLPSVITINSAENYLYSIGLSLFSSKPQTRNRFHNPFFISLIICVSILKSITVILIKEDIYKLLLIGDFAYFINGRYVINFAIILWGLLAFSLQILHYWKYYKNESPSYLKPLEMISGLVSPKSIGFMNREDINEFIQKSKLMFKVTKLVIIGPSFCTFFLTIIPLIANSSYKLYLIAFFWSLLYTAFAYFCSNINLYQLLIFTLFACI